MRNSVTEFGKTAQGLAKNPLGIIALFIVLIYGFACLVVGVSGHLQSIERLPIIWFMVIFPVIVLGVFAWLVSQHHKKLYAPSDYKDESHFLENSSPELSKLAYVSKSTNHSEVASSESDWSNARRNIYKENKGYFIAHVLEPTNKDGQEYDIFIYLIKHKSQDYKDVSKAEFFFGEYWGNKVYVGSSTGKYIGVRTSAYGPFLALCKITFKDGTSITISKYIDFEMGFAVKNLVQ
ncbi:pYEATS domain-containing protein [Shewanella xiamenensis]|uniref:pYEATS domain-containing protein n=1 Tax=Shewanella xiamenensis TaxID=332186 RepID=UPI00313DCE74